MSAQAMLRRVTGLTVSKAAADRAIRERMELTGEVNREHYLASLTQQELTELVELVVVPESWLFRDPQAFLVAVEFVQGRLARRAPGTPARPVRILSVPCAGGEEPYSLAMALCDADVPRNAFSIDACDLSPGCVARARKGVYGRNAFRAQDLAFRERYFTSVANDDYLISEAIRAQVRFSQGNLLELDAGGRRYDIIFCRNLLIYFDKPTTSAAIDRLSALLADDGILFAGYAEVPSFAHNGFTPLPHRQAFGLRKDIASDALSKLGNKDAKGRLFFQTKLQIAELPSSLPQGKADNQILGVVRSLEDEQPGRAVVLVPSPPSWPTAKACRRMRKPLKCA
eukprot:gene25809-32304_t